MSQQIATRIPGLTVARTGFGLTFYRSGSWYGSHGEEAVTACYFAGRSLCLDLASFTVLTPDECGAILDALKADAPATKPRPSLKLIPGGAS